MFGTSAFRCCLPQVLQIRISFDACSLILGPDTCVQQTSVTHAYSQHYSDERERGGSHWSFMNYREVYLGCMQRPIGHSWTPMLWIIIHVLSEPARAYPAYLAERLIMMVTNERVS